MCYTHRGRVHTHSPGTAIWPVPHTGRQRSTKGSARWAYDPAHAGSSERGARTGACARIEQQLQHIDAKLLLIERKPPDHKTHTVTTNSRGTNTAVMTHGASWCHTAAAAATTTINTTRHTHTCMPVHTLGRRQPQQHPARSARLHSQSVFDRLRWPQEKRPGGKWEVGRWGGEDKWQRSAAHTDHMPHHTTRLLLYYPPLAHPAGAASCSYAAATASAAVAGGGSCWAAAAAALQVAEDDAASSGPTGSGAQSALCLMQQSGRERPRALAAASAAPTRSRRRSLVSPA